ncbi:dUTP diphosphatase [Campylobacter upsaliensis]|uniref:dUTPase n=1 Tax=Campylobacter upsaliensis TaxID=28080 RepID=UPI00126C5C36|nr:dUTP diphosphatase [Campylobacter upsaliensis]EAH9987520.1 dUTPase [Campylobacter upsaliensis]EAI0687448.1 dUTPase [Campylobacter upsaliensis]EAI2045195.1 dUTPase [Campylobacter upsaliensis]EAI2445263.1 dUTPase [Campylobacter upsaliensis]EAI8053990.1 dUTPase [Campylobacter upsaliensis]
MKNTDLLENMLKLQQKLNDETNGKGWENGYTKEGKLISWRRCIYMECAELIDSFAWKHWKSIKNPTNWDNVRIELVDIWHFILSLLLEERGKKELSFIAMELSSVSAFKDFIKEKGTPSDEDMYAIISDIELIIHKCSGFGFDIGELLSAFFILCAKCGLNLENLYKIYIGKNVLNAFRQTHGYKEGLYKKLWNDKEDNEILNEILNQTLSYEAIYKELEKRYEAL